MTFTWSLSRLKDYEKCPRLYFYRKRPREYPEPPSRALDRGNQIHGLLEAAVRDAAPLEGALSAIKPYVDELRAAKSIVVEQMWGYGADWKVRDDAPWLRMKLDVYTQSTPKRGKVVDWKTGRIYGDHGDGMRLYAVGAMERFGVTTVDVELVYLDQRQIIGECIKAKEIPAIRADFDARVKVVVEDTRFDPTPGSHCGYCAFSEAKGGPCLASRS